MLQKFILIDSLLQMRFYQARTFFLFLLCFLGCYFYLISISFSNGVNQRFSKILQRLHQPSVMVSAGATNMIIAGKSIPNQKIIITDKDLQSFKKAFPPIQEISPGLTDPKAKIDYLNKKIVTPVLGKTFISGKIENDIVMPQGRFIVPTDLENNARVAVITPYIKNYLFGSQNSVGKIISINGLPFQVIGVLDPRNNLFSGNTTNILIPYTTAQLMWQKQKIWFEIELNTVDVGNFITSFNKYLRQRFHVAADDQQAFNFYQHTDDLKYMNQFVNGFRLIFFTIGLLMLFITNVAYANFIYYAVKTRRKEIGLKIALGCSMPILRTQLLTESLFYIFINFILALCFTIITDLILKDSSLLPDWFGIPSLNFFLTITGLLLFISSTLFATLFPLNLLLNNHAKNILESI